MARGLILSSQATCLVSRFPLSLLESRNLMLKYLNSTRSFCCKSSLNQHQIDFNKYKESFSKQMTFAGLKPHHRIAIGVSGGPDSMALCVLTAAWKTEGNNAVAKPGDFIDGLLAIVVDHGLRPESKQEAHLVSGRLFEMGIRCEIASCSWSLGRPKQGHLQEAARNMRYQKLQNICLQHHTGVLLIAHHADDQAELFILRLSRKSGVLGLAGMAFVSQMFSSTTQLYDEGSMNKGILLVRPLLHLSKEDMHKVCQVAGQDWVEDPTNRSPLFARNRIRMSLGNCSSYKFKCELQALISACRKTRSFVDQYCINLINKAVTLIHQQGYAIIDLDVLNPSKVMDICLVKFAASILQFISQRHKPVRGSASKLLLDYIRSYPCKTSLTAAGCYLCPVPGSRGTKILVCCSVDSPLPSRMELTSLHSDGELGQYVPTELEQIIADGKAYLDHFVSDASDVYFLDYTSESILTEAKKVSIITDSTYRNILLLQRDEIEHFKAKTEDSAKSESENEVEPTTASLRDQLRPGQTCFFMNRFFITWKLSKHKNTNDVSVKAYCGCKMGGESWHHDSSLSCTIDHYMCAAVRHMNEHDWLYLAKLSKHSSLGDTHKQSKTEQTMEKSNLDYMRFSARSTLEVLKSIPVAARRSLPVLVNHVGQLLSIPSIGFKICPCLTVSCVFKPRVPLGGGYSSFM